VNDAVNGPAAIADGHGGFIVDEVQVDAPGPGEVRIRIAAAGICHTDHASLSWPGPLVIGHEGAGHVDAVGSGVERVAVGEKVLLNWSIPCGLCPQCHRGNASLCDRTHGTNPALYGTSSAHHGATRWHGEPVARAFHLGTFSRYTLVRASAVTSIPEGFPLEQACILGCAVMTGIGSVVNVASVTSGDTVAVVGCGGVGLNVIQGARLAGADRIIAIDRRQTSLARACEFGATDMLMLADDGDVAELIGRVKELTNGSGVDHSFEVTGNAELAFLPLRLIRNGGHAVQVSGAFKEVQIDMQHFLWNKCYTAPLYGGCVPHRDFPRLIDWAIKGEIELRALINRQYSLPQLSDAFDDMLAGRVAKGVVWVN
jgi:S-(hydroxymethyl)glutathione dehydrogenase / alcohol dehydrogenase